LAQQVVFNSLKIILISKERFGKIIGKSYETIQKWIDKGVILPPAYEDSSKVKRAWGKDYTYKYFLQSEAVAVRKVIRKYNPRRGWIPTEDFIAEIHKVMLAHRDAVERGDKSLLTYPIVLEFSGLEDMVSYFNKANNDFEKVYKMGDKLLGKIVKEERDDE